MAEKSTGLYAYVSTGKSAGSTGPSTQLYSTLLIFLVWSTGPLLIIFGRPDHSIIFPSGVVHRVENGWGLTKVAVVLLNGLLWKKMIYILKLHLYTDILSCDPKKN